VLTDGLTRSRVQFSGWLVAEDRNTPYDGSAQTPNPLQERTRVRVYLLTADVRFTKMFGVQITSADRANGRITGSKAGAAVSIDLRPQADNTLQVIFSAPNSKESNPTLNDRWLRAYQSRMGR